jgi:hypothetical protein
MINNYIQIMDNIKKLSNIQFNTFGDYKIINQYNNFNKDNIEKLTKEFYKKYYDDNKKRRLIIGSNPSRRGTVLTGIPFENISHLKENAGIMINGFNFTQNSNNFLYDVINEYGGCKKFYSEFYMNFVFPLGISKANNKGNEINCNYYDEKKLIKELYDYILDSIKDILKINIDTSICYCIGSGENYKFLLKINNEFNYFKKIIPLEHPRYIMQYNSKREKYYLQKYLNVLNIK